MDSNQAFLAEVEVDMLYDGLIQLEAGYSVESLVAACKRYIEEKEEEADG